MIAPSLLEITGDCGFVTEISRAASASAVTAGCITLVWKAPETWSGRTRAPAGGFSASLAKASSGPAATIWPPPFSFAGVRPRARSASTTTSRSPPKTADIPVLLPVAAADIARPRTFTRARAESPSKAPAMLAAVISPTE